MAADKVPVHSELPPAKGDTPYALQVLLDLYREQFLAMVENMKTDAFRKSIENQITAEKVDIFLVLLKRSRKNKCLIIVSALCFDRRKEIKN